jgi:hypothetical protein
MNLHLCRSHRSAAKYQTRGHNKSTDIASTAFGTPIALLMVMTDERYLTLLVWTICVLMFACGVVAITQHPQWFGA